MTASRQVGKDEDSRREVAGETVNTPSFGKSIIISSEYD
jgi:hypothetical protein